MAKPSRIFLFLTVLSLLLSACGSDTQSCKVSSECDSKSCQIASCASGECTYSPEPNCCGNGKKDAIEDGKKGSSCTCPQDHGKCEGSAQVKVGNSRAVDATYVKKHCSGQECVLGVDPDVLKPTTLLDENSLSAFDIEITTTLNQPFRVPTDSLSFRVRLKDAKEGVVYPIKFTHISLRDGEILYGEKDLTAALGGVGDISTFSVPILYRLTQPEEERRLSYKIDYDYTITTNLRDSSGNMVPTPKTSRESFENRFGTKLLFAQDGVS